MLKISIDTEHDFYPKISLAENLGLLTNYRIIFISIVFFVKNLWVRSHFEIRTEGDPKTEKGERNKFFKCIFTVPEERTTAGSPARSLGPFVNLLSLFERKTDSSFVVLVICLS